MKTLEDIRYAIAHHFMSVKGDNHSKVSDLQELIKELQFYIKALNGRENLPDHNVKRNLHKEAPMQK